MGNYTKSEIEQKIKHYKVWFQNINLNGIETNPSESNSAKRWANIEPYIPKDLAGKNVLDLGCNAGYFSIKMRERGAKVLGVDWYPEAIEQAKFVAKVLNLDIEYRLENIYEFILNNKQTFDYVLFLGLFYHLRYPLLVLDKVAEIVKEKLYFQTIIRNKDSDLELSIPENITDINDPVFEHSNFPKMFFIEKELSGAYNNWFLCNENAVYSILRSSGFKNITKSGYDSFICEPENNKQKWKYSHNVSDIKLNEPKQSDS